MTQALSISMLMLGADITLTSDTKAANAQTADNQLPQTDEGDVEQGSGFSALLQGMVQPANSGKAGLGQRQFSAAGSELSALSAAMLQATNPDAASSDDPALANSLLLQIALKNQPADKAEADSEVATAEGEATVELALDQTETQTETDSDTDAEADSSLSGKQQPALAADSKSITVDTKPAADTGMAEDAATANSDSSQTKQLANDAAKAATPTVAQTADSLAAGVSSDAQPTAGQSQTALTVGEAAPDSAVSPDAELAQQQNQHGDAAKLSPGAASTGPDKAEPVKNRTASATASITKPTETLTEAVTQASPVLTAEPVSTVSSQIKAKNDGKADDKSALSNSGSEKLSPKADSANLSKSAAAEQGTQQQQQGQAQSERQFAALASHNSSTKPVAEPARGETSFVSSLHSAESRQQTHSSKVVTKSATEQLKQSLNLQQHDAAGQLQQRVSIMLRQNIQVAEIRLDPAGLGQMQIKIDVQQEQTNVQFVVQQPQAKELLEQQLPRLRELLQQQGIVLGEGSVQQQSQQERQLSERQQHNSQGRQQGTADDGLGDDSIQTQLKVAPSDRLVDYYA
ncbi:flagellar hook-length control protein FliK [Rheinheimera muenzenbergensis]|uniref:Flagellar hook-length control protein FliK n=1 Tax=Rheinheimera muenzenbergensis TaxID=1193628 RepID=A0ABU8C225_9GAMM